jgi:small multidrug resistance pump
MSWIYLTVAICLEVSGTICMKLSQGFTHIPFAIAMLLFYGFGFATLTLALKTIEISIAYAIWAGLGTALIATVGILWFKEPLTAIKIISLGLIILGVIGLNINGTPP